MQKIDVRHIAKLARLKIEDEEAQRLEQEMGAIVDMVENLPPLTGAGALLDENDIMELRPDEVKPSTPREDILKNAPHSEKGCFLVPKTVD